MRVGLDRYQKEKLPQHTVFFFFCFFFFFLQHDEVYMHTGKMMGVGVVSERVTIWRLSHRRMAAPVA